MARVIRTGHRGIFRSDPGSPSFVLHATVLAIKRCFPGPAAVVRNLPVLADTPVRRRRPRDPVGDLAFRRSRHTRHLHDTILKTAVKLQQVAAIVHPGLMPTIALAVPDVETLALH